MVLGDRIAEMGYRMSWILQCNAFFSSEPHRRATASTTLQKQKRKHVKLLSMQFIILNYLLLILKWLRQLPTRWALDSGDEDNDDSTRT